MVDNPRSNLLTRLRMFRILVAILMLVSTGVVLTHGCSHDSISHEQNVAAHVESDHGGTKNQDESTPGHCCQFHCHQLVSLAPISSSALSAVEPRNLDQPTYRIIYSDPSLSLLTRPPLAA